jgi:ABC-2 type transport system permease protein
VAAVVMFMAVGVLTSQLASTRHDANLIGGAVLTTSYLVRMAADSDPRIGWLRWASPIGWIEQLRPLIGSAPWAFVPVVVFTAVVVVVAVRAAAHRDVGEGLLPARDTRPPRTFLLGGQAGLTVRLTAPVAVAWLVPVGITGLVFGLVTQAAGRSLKSSPTIERVIARLGATGAGAATYLGFVFLIAAGLVAVAAAGQITAMRGEEDTGHLDNLLVRPVARWRWLLVRIAVGLGLVVVAGLVTGVGAWIGAVTQHAAVSFGSLLQAGINIVPPSVFVLGIGVLVYGLWPRAAVTVTYALIAWSVLVETLAGISRINRWVRDASPFLHIRPVPAASPDWQAASWLTGLGLVAAVAGIVAFARRDIEGA